MPIACCGSAIGAELPHIDTYLYDSFSPLSMAGIDAELFKALSDGNRLIILEMLSRGETCACRLLEALDVTQPTLSHHMKILCGCGLVTARKSGQWSYYSLNREKLDEVRSYLSSL